MKGTVTIVTKSLRWISVLILIIAMLSQVSFADESGYGSSAALEQENFTIEEMLEYALEDEYHAMSEYQAIMDEFDIGRPFSNIIKAEERHIEWLIPLFEDYNVDFISNVSAEYVVIPQSIQDAFEIGVQAEINNISMYDKFLKQDLPSDVKDIFERLKSASENHLKAFERNSSGNDGGRRGQGRF